MSADFNPLAGRRCEACTPQTPALSQTEIESYLTFVPKWQQNGQSLERRFRFDDYYQTMAFANAVAWIAHREDHHPVMEVGYKQCVVRYTTHAIVAISENDFICAAKVDGLVAG